MSNDLFKTGRARGGMARAAALNPAVRQQIAKKAALARWGAKATHKGSFLKDFGIDVDCYVLDDERHTAVISQRGMGQALGLAASGTALQRLLATKAMLEAGGSEILQKLKNHIKFQWGTGGSDSPPPSIVYGFESDLLIDVCTAVIAAERFGLRRPGVATQARIILTASAKSGIQRLVYDLAGYNPTTEEAINAFKLYVLEEAKKYEPEFPNELYTQWYRLYDLAAPETGRPWTFKHLTLNHVYFPLAKSHGKILELLRANKGQGGDRRKKLFQFLNEIGARALRMHLGRILEMAESSPSKVDYERRVAQRFGDQMELDLEPTSSTA
ncbi:MAG: P63C domain-containing protein [Stellaceae bacterium]